MYIPSKKWGIFPPRIIDGGVTILSRFPILDTAYELYDDATVVCHKARQSSYIPSSLRTNMIRFLFPLQSTADMWCAKGLVWAKIALPGPEGKHIHVFSTHMQAHDHPDGRYSKACRGCGIPHRG